MRLLTEIVVFRHEHAPRIMAALVAGSWQISGEDGLNGLAALACDITDALWEEMRRRWDTESDRLRTEPDASVTPSGGPVD